MAVQPRYRYSIDGVGMLCAQEFLVPVQLEKRSGVNHLWIYDVSGSMHWLLPQVGEDLLAKIKELRKGDTVTLGWFSGEGNFKVFLIGFKIADDSDFIALETLIKENLRSRGCTCFSEILDFSVGVTDTLKAIAPANSFELTFFTDGYPVVSNYNREIENIFKAIKKLKVKLDAALLVGYGAGFNRELMADMAKSFNGTLVFSADLGSYSSEMREYLNDVAGIQSKVAVFLPEEAEFAYYLLGNTVSLLEKGDGGEVYVPVSETQTSGFVYYLTKEVAIGTRAAELDWPKPMYALVLLLNQQCKTYEAMKVLARIGDVHCIDKLNNAFTNEEYTQAEECIRNAIGDATERYKAGIDTDYLPKDDAFCLLDALNLVMSDPEARFFPYHSDFSYNRTGRKTEAKDEDHVKFVPNAESDCSFASLVWNSKRLNLSVYTTVKGTVDLPDTCKELGLASPYPTFIHRNYTLVKDGHANVDLLPVKLGSATLATLKDAGMIAKEYAESGLVSLSLNAVPVINRKMAMGKYTAKDLCEKIVEEVRLGAVIKVYKYFLDQNTEEAPAPVSMSEKQKDFLWNMVHIDDDGAFSPPSKAAEPVDFYYANTFEIKLRGLSSLPKVEAVLEKMKTPKALVISEKFVAEGIQKYNNSVPTELKGKLLCEWIDAEIKAIKKAQGALRKEVQRTKFAIILGKAWFEEFKTRQPEYKVNIGTIECTITLGTEKVAI